jgi:hypothetical protein
MNIHLKIKEYVNKKGAEIIVSNTLIGMLDDEFVFDDVEAVPYKKILRNIIKEGYAQKLLDLGSYTPDVNFLASQYASKNLMQEPPVLYVLDCLAYGLGWMDKEPTLQMAAPEPTTKNASTNIKNQKAPLEDKQTTETSSETPQKEGFFTKIFNMFKSHSDVDMNVSADDCYSKGETLAHTNIKEAVKWFERGAKLGHGGCANELAVYYYTKNQKKKALNYAQNAKDCGFLDSAFVVGMNYFERALKTENEDDFINAFSHISAALNPPKNTPKDHLLSEGLVPQAKGLLGFCYMGMPGIPANMAKAKSLLNEAIAGGSAEAKLWYDQFKQAGIL